MNIIRIIFYLFITIALFICSCTKQADKTSNDISLADRWQWIETHGGIANQIHETPISTGKNIDLVVTKDNKYFFYINGTLVSQGTYILDTKNCIHDHKDKRLINFSSASNQDMMIEKLDKDNLELSDESYDGIGSLYKRKASNIN